MANTPLGWYKWYPRDFMASSKVRRMSITAQGVYRALLDLQWEDGNVPETYDEAKLILGLTEVEAMSFEVFYDLCFPDGKNPKLHTQRAQQLAFIESQKKKGGRPSKGDSGSNKDENKPSQNLGLTKPKPTPSQTETETDNKEDNKLSSCGNEPPAKPQRSVSAQQERFQRIKTILQALSDRKGWGEVMDADVKRNLGKNKAGLGELIEWLESGKSQGRHDQDCNDAAVRMFLKAEAEFDGKCTWETVFNHKGRIWDLMNGAGKSSNPIIEGTRFQFKGEEVAV